MAGRALSFLIVLVAAVLMPAAVLFWILNGAGFHARTVDRLVAGLEWVWAQPWTPWAAGALALVAGTIAFALLAPASRDRPLILIDRISAWVGKLFAWNILILTLAVCFEVFSRRVLRQPTTWAFDMSYILYGGLFMMGGAYALSRNGHVRGDFLYRAWPPRVQAGLDLVLYLLFFFPGVTALIYSGIGYARLAWRFHEHSSFSVAGPPLYTFKALIPIAGALLFLQGLAEVLRCIACLRAGAWPQRLHDVEELEKVILEEQQAKQAGAEGAAR